MASASFQVARNGSAFDNLANGSQAITEGAAAPTTANQLELRIDLAAGWTKLEIVDALEQLQRFFLDTTKSTSITL